MVDISSSSMRVLSVSTPSLPAENLLERVVQGDPQALGKVYDQHHEALRAFAQRLVGEAQAAEDLVQEVFVALPRLLRRFRGDSSLRTFLTGVAINHARRYVRSATRRRAAFERMSTMQSLATESSPESLAERRSLASALSRALDSLPLKQRVAFVLCDVEERSSIEVATIVGVPEGTIRTRLHHARRTLRSRLDKEGFTSA